MRDGLIKPVRDELVDEIARERAEALRNGIANGNAEPRRIKQSENEDDQVQSRFHKTGKPITAK